MGANDSRSRCRRNERPSGRHFLVRKAAADLVRGFGIRSSDLVIEVGAGDGNLTKELARSAGLVLAVELDAELSSRLLRRAAAWPNVYIQRGDALAIRLPESPFRVVGNAPFGITTALLRRLTSASAATRLDLVLQLEAARKRATPKGSALSVIWATTWRFEVRKRIPATTFRPIPSVDAAWLEGRRRSVPLVSPTDMQEFEGFVRGAFGRASLPVVRAIGFSRKRVRAASVDPDARVTELAVNHWVRLFNHRTNTGR